MGLIPNEKEAEQQSLEQWPEKADRIWNLYLSIKKGRQKLLGESITAGELSDIEILWDQGIIYYDSKCWSERPVNLTISAIPFETTTDEIQFL